MADLFAILNTAQSSLSAQRALSATASHNIANANTPGYARQEAILEAVTPAEQGSGVFIGRGATLSSVTQSRDRYLEAQLPAAFGRAAQSSAESEALQAVHALDPEASSGLGPAISGFYSALRALAQNPNDSGLRATFLSSAQTMAQAFNITSQGIASARSGLDQQATGLVDEVNSESQAVALLNEQIHLAQSSGAQPNDLLDLRQRHLDKLAELTGAVSVQTSDGGINVTLPGGLALVAGTRAGSLIAEGDGANGGHVAIKLQQADGTGSFTLPNSALGGMLGGTLSARDGALLTAATRVDQLASDLVGAINTEYVHGYGWDPTAGTGGGWVNGRPLFSVGATNAASTMTVRVTDASQLATSRTYPPLSGDATNLTAVLGTDSVALTGGKDVEGTLSDIVAQFGGATARAKAFADQDAGVKDNLQAMRDSYSGVSIDDELIKMQAAQRAYEAITKVIQTADQMMETLLNLR